MSVVATALMLMTATLPGVGTPVLATTGGVAVVADPSCPVVIERVALERTAQGVVLVYSIRNNAKEAVKGIMLTAASVEWTGEVRHVEMVPFRQSVSGGASAEQRASFSSVELAGADRIHVGVQAVQWKGRRSEWRGALKLNTPVTLAARD